MNRYFTLWGCFIKNCLVREMEFSANLLLQLFGNLIWFIFTILFFSVIYQHTETINGWTNYNTYLLVATNQIIIYLYQSLFARNLNRFPGLIKRGELDHFLIKPIDVQFIISIRYFDIKPILLLPLPIYLLIYSMRGINSTPSFLDFLSYILLVLCGIALRYLIGFVVMILSFFFVEISSLYAMQDEFLRYASYPSSIFKKFSLFFFTYIIPVVLIANLPVSAILQTMKNYQAISLFTILYIVIVFFLSRRMFLYCLKNYASASS